MKTRTQNFKEIQKLFLFHFLLIYTGVFKYENYRASVTLDLIEFLHLFLHFTLMLTGTIRQNYFFCFFLFEPCCIQPTS